MTVLSLLRLTSLSNSHKDRHLLAIYARSVATHCAYTVLCISNLPTCLHTFLSSDILKGSIPHQSNLQTLYFIYEHIYQNYIDRNNGQQRRPLPSHHPLRHLCRHVRLHLVVVPTSMEEGCRNGQRSCR